MGRLGSQTAPLPGDENERETAKALKTLVRPAIPVALAWAVVFGLAVPGSLQRTLVQAFGISGLALVSLGLAHAGRARLAARILVGGMCAGVFASAWTAGGAHATSYAGFAAAITLAGLLLGHAAVLAIACVAFAAGGALVLAEHRDLLPAPAYHVDATSAWLGAALVFALVALFQQLGSRRAERAVQKVQSYRDIFDAASVGLLEIDLSGVDSHETLCDRLDAMYIRHANEEALRLLDARDVTDALGPCSQTIARLDAQGHTVQTEGGFVQRPMQLRTQTGATHDVLFSMRWSDHPKARTKTVVSTIDITERRTLEQRIRQLERLETLGRLAGGVAHDFNNLLTVISGHVALLQERVGDDPECRPNLAALEETAARAARLTRQLLAFNRREAKPAEVMEVDPLVDTLRGLVSRLIGEDIQLEVALGAPLSSVRIEPSHVEQIVMNLVLNARDAMPRGGRLRIETSVETHAPKAPACAAGYVRISVTDTGQGMDEGTLSHVFEPFFTTKPRERGTGLGLATVQSIVRNAQGRIDVKSRVGQGTRVDVWLPRELEQPVEHVRRRVDSTVAPRRASLLLVEDQVDVREVAAALLESAGYEVRSVGSAEDALSIAGDADTRIDAVVTDVVLTGLSGADLMERLSAVRPNLPFVFMSGYTSDVVVRHGVEQETAIYVQKPFTQEQLVRALDAAMERQKTTDRYAAGG